MADEPHPFLYPKDDNTPNVFINPKWLYVPVLVPDNIANVYVSGTGVVDFSSEDPEWSWKISPLSVVPGTLKLTFKAESPLTSGDIYIKGSIIATVGLARVEREVSYAADRKPVKTEEDDWLIALDSVVAVDVEAGSTVVRIEISGAIMADVWMDKISYHIGLLIHRPSPDGPPRLWQPPENFPWAALTNEVGRLKGLLQK